MCSYLETTSEIKLKISAFPEVTKITHNKKFQITGPVPLKEVQATGYFLIKINPTKKQLTHFRTIINFYTP